MNEGSRKGNQYLTKDVRGVSKWGEWGLRTPGRWRASDLGAGCKSRVVAFGVERVAALAGGPGSARSLFLLLLDGGLLGLALWFRLCGGGPAVCP